MPTHVPVPNEFTIEPIVEIVVTLYDGSKVWRRLNLREFREWQENGGDPEDLVDDEDA